MKVGMAEALPGKVLAEADVVVVGGGISGQTAAASAAARGASVLLLEKETQPAFEGSGRAQGSLRLQGRAAAELPLAQEAIELWKQVGDEADIELSFGGNIYLCDDPAELPRLRGLVETAHKCGLDQVDLLEPERARSVLPGADGPFTAAMWSPHDGQCDPGKATRHFADVAAGRGARQLYGVRVRRVLEQAGSVTGVATEQGVVKGRAVIVAGGVWTPHLARTVGVKVPIMPVVVSQCETTPSALRVAPTVRAFACGFRQRPDGRIVLSAGLNTIVEHRVTAADLYDVRTWLTRFSSNRRNVRMRLDVPATLAQLRIGAPLSTRLVPRGTEPPPPNRGGMERALTALHELMPGTRDAAIDRVWSGWIDLSPDGLPIIDGHAGPRGLSLATGMSGHGLALGPVTGEILADLALDGRTARPIHPFRVSRFREERVPSPEKMI
jgi:glycine/D-amino acid oxidase-like deaminating enzyme